MPGQPRAEPTRQIGDKKGTVVERDAVMERNKCGLCLPKEKHTHIHTDIQRSVLNKG